MTTDVITAVLPAYEHPPQWIPVDQRFGNPEYANDLKHFLPRTIHLRRENKSDSLGFNIRGGAEHFSGIYISRVLEDSEPQRQGLKEGDQVLFVNGVNFERIEHDQAVHVLKSQNEVQLSVRFFPFGYQRTCERIQPLIQNLQPKAQPS